MEQMTLTAGELGADEDTPARARREAREFLALHGLTGREDDVLLVISELITNSVLHAQAAPELVLRRLLDSSGLVVEVHDPSPVLPVEREPDLALKGGRGIRLVSALADKWGVELRGAAGKTIWAEFHRP